MEIDCYDTPFARYLVSQSHAGIADAGVRLSPTDLHSMLGDNWPEMWRRGCFPHSPSVLEATRLGVGDWLRGEARRSAKQSLVVAMLEHGLAMKIKAFVAVMPPSWWKSVFVEAGWTVQRVGPDEGTRRRDLHRRPARRDPRQS
jgi:N-acyl-L-homoserine lactone synthetase